MTWSQQTAEGLAYLHGQKVIHRDLKPLNLGFLLLFPLVKMRGGGGKSVLFFYLFFFDIVLVFFLFLL